VFGFPSEAFSTGPVALVEHPGPPGPLFSDRLTYHGPHFDGDTYEPGEDYQRLGTLLERVLAFMLDHKWHTLQEIHKATQPGTEASVSARLRDLRKPKHGSYTVDRERVCRGLHHYRIPRPPGAGQMDLSYQ